MPDKKPKSRMDAYITRAGAIVGIIGGVLGIFAFFKADSTMEAFRHRGKLQVSGKPPTLKIVIPKGGTSFTIDTANVTYGVAELEISNIGDLPAKDVQIAATYRQQSTIEDPVFAPTLSFQKLTQGNTVFYTLQRPIAPKSHLAVTLSPAPPLVTVTDENGETSTVSMAPSASVEFVGTAKTLPPGDWKGWTPVLPDPTPNAPASPQR